jgi:hypothetical protein
VRIGGLAIAIGVAANRLFGGVMRWHWQPPGGPVEAVPARLLTPAPSDGTAPSLAERNGQEAGSVVSERRTIVPHRPGWSR